MNLPNIPMASGNLVHITLDGTALAVPAGTNLIEAARLLGKEVPHYCYHPKLSISGNCRMCLVEVGMPLKDKATGQWVHDEQGAVKIGWMPKPAIACATTVAEGMQVRTQSPLVKACQEGVMEFLLLNHPLDCPICDQAGECRLQEFATDYGRGYSRFDEAKNTKPKRTLLGPRVMLDDERCILCSRCIRFMKEVANDDVLGFTQRGSHTTLTCYPGRELTSNYSLNTVDICPVGALTSTDFRFKMRVWFLKRTNSICTESSTGVNTELWSREGVIHRITPRRNDAVNDCWMPDSGRLLYHQVQDPSRLLQWRAKGAGDAGVPPQQALQAALQALRKAQGRLAYVAGGGQSVEEFFALQQLIKAYPGTPYLVGRYGPGDGFLIAKDGFPNTRGALVTGYATEAPAHGLSPQCLQALQDGTLTTLVVYNQDLLALGVAPEVLEKLFIIYLGTHENATSRQAQVVLPVATVFEKQGSFINRQFRLQAFAQAIPPPPGVFPDTYTLQALASGEFGLGHSTIEALWAQLASHHPHLDGLSWQTLPATGQVLDKAIQAFAHLQFIDAHQPSAS
jgi:NADH-quinone oxidoreductase subunit G